MERIDLVRGVNRVVGAAAPEWTAARWQHAFTHPRRAPRRPWEVGVEASAARDRLRVGWSFLRWAPAGAPRGRVFCLHGWEGRGTQFGPLAERLVAHGLEVVALDAPGHGASPERSAHPVAFARAALDAGRELGPFDAAVGHSMGAGALVMALAWGLPADRAALLAPPASMAGVLDRFAGHVGLPEPARRRFVAGMAALVGFHPAELDLTHIAGALRQPGLVVHDLEDAEVPVDDGRALYAAWPGATWLPVEGLGHRRLLRDAGVIERVVAFVAPAGEGRAARPLEAGAGDCAPSAWR